MKTNLLRYTLSLLFLIIKIVVCAQSIDIPGPVGSGKFGQRVYNLPNGNFVVCDANYDQGATADVGAVYLYNGATLALISTLKGDMANDNVGFDGIVVLPNSNFLVKSSAWHGGTSSGIGAVTWVNGTTGLSGVVNSSNSLVGTTSGDFLGVSVSVLTNGNYVISTPYWNNGAANNSGAVTWGNGSSGISGSISSSISLVGTVSGETVGSVTPLTNGHYVVSAISWNNGFGAATWCNGTTGRVGTISGANSLIGNNAVQFVGSYITALSNGNYVVVSYNWSSGVSGVGAVTLGNGATGTVGTVSAANSLIGSSPNDQVGSNGIMTLPNGDYIVASPVWDNGAITDAGAVTLCNGSTPTTGIVNAANSLVGSSTNDNVGSGFVYLLTNNNYVVASPFWDNGGITDAGAITWVNSNTGLTGPITSSNSLVGGTANDKIGFNNNSIYIRFQPVTALTNGNYVVTSPYWDNGGISDAGAATWCDGSTGRTGLVSAANSLVGNKPNDNISFSGIFALSNGHYVVASERWGNGVVSNAGAITWCDGTTGSTGVVGAGNSLTGTVSNDFLEMRVYPLNNGNYVTTSYYWDNGGSINAGFAGWCNGASGRTGIVDQTNSLVGATAGDLVSYPFSDPFINGNYVISSGGWDNGASSNVGAVTLCNGATGTTGFINSCNSVLGTAVNGGGLIRYVYDPGYDQLIVGRASDNMVTIYRATGMAIANHLDEGTLAIYGNNPVPFIANEGCRLICTVAAIGANPVAGSVATKSWIESTVPTFGGDPFVARHYEITPATNASTATGRVTLYFTQQEFNDFNNHPASLLDLPAGPADAVGKANLRIGKFGGTSNDGSGLPGSYPGTREVIDPADIDVFWNSNKNRWEISFDVTGFSGFVVQTKPTVLPLTFLEFKGQLQNNNGLLSWKTSQEINVHSFDIERSLDGRTFHAIGNMPALNQPGNNFYHYTDYNITTLGVPVIYYRLLQKDNSGQSRRSGIMALSVDKSRNIVLLYPNPVTMDAVLTISIHKKQPVKGRILDNTGRIIKTLQWNLPGGSSVIPVELKDLTKGVYYIELTGDTFSETKRFVKQ